MYSIKDQPLLLKEFDSSYISKYSTDLVKEASDAAFSLLHETHKGHMLFKDKFVADIRFQETDEGGFYITSKVKAEMSKNKAYNIQVVLSKENEVLSANCNCAAGLKPGTCKHIFASLYALVDYSTKEIYLAPTEKIQAWHKPKPTKDSPKTFKEVFGKSNPLVARRKLNYSALFSGTQPYQLLSVLKDSTRLAESFTLPLPACVLSGRPVSTLPNLNLEEFLFLNERLKFNLEDMWQLERDTREQSGCTLWKDERLLRITASNFFEICHRKADVNVLAEKLISPKDKSHIYPIKYGTDNEPYVRNIIRQSFPKHNLRRTGLITNPFFPHFGASPDGLLRNKDSAFLLEIKSMVNEKNLDIEDLAKSSLFCLEKKGDEWVS